MVHPLPLTETPFAVLCDDQMESYRRIIKCQVKYPKNFTDGAQEFMSKLVSRAATPPRRTPRATCHATRHSPQQAGASSPRPDSPTCRLLTLQHLRAATSQLVADPKKRLGCLKNGPADIKNLSWFKGLDWKELESKNMPAPWVPPIKSATDDSNFDEFEDEAILQYSQNNFKQTDPNFIEFSENWVGK